MKYQRRMLLLALCTAVAACGAPNATISYGKAGSITLKDSQVTLHVDGALDAVIGSSGDLSIDDKPVWITPADRGLLMIYHQNVLTAASAMRESGEKIGLATLKNKLSSDGNASSNEKPVDDAKQQERQVQLKFCQDQANIKTVQDQLAIQLSSFKPYGNIVSSNSIANCQKDATN
jgi:hypothetical protein